MLAAMGGILVVASRRRRVESVRTQEKARTVETKVEAVESVEAVKSAGL
jgi:hypothetical protein